MATKKVKKLAFGGMSNAVRAAADKAATQIQANPRQPALTRGGGQPLSQDVIKKFADARQALTGKPSRQAMMKKGGDVKESKAMVKKEIGFMKKAGAPKSMIKHEMAEAKGMKKGGMAECKTIAKKEVKGHEKRMHGMAKGGSIDGCAIRGKTKTSMIKMKKGGSC
jgi:hypothetical protein